MIGTGSSAIQIVPQVRKKAGRLTAFMRSVTWISLPVAGQFLEDDKSHSSDETQKKNPQA